MRNLDSAFRDHSYYRKNWDQCLPLLGQTIAAICGFADELPADNPVLVRFFRHRAWRVNWLTATRWLIGAAAIFAAISRPAGLADLDGLVPRPVKTLLGDRSLVTDEILLQVDDVLRGLIVILVLAGLAYLGAFGILG